MASRDPLDSLPSLTAGDSLPVQLSLPAPIAAASDNVVATFELNSPSPTAVANTTYFGTSDATAQLQNISLTDDAEVAVSSAAQQPGSAVLAASAPAAAAAAVAAQPAAAQSVHRPAGDAEAPAAASAQPEPVLPPTVAGPLHQQEIAVKVWVRDPEKVERSRIGVPFGSYMTYLLRTETSLAIFGEGMPTADSGTAAGEQDSPSSTAAANTSAPIKQSSREGVHVWEVRRRFADFEELHRLLRQHFRGYFLPPLPDKSFLESRFAGDSFLKVRKVDLQAYMCTVANHPALQSSQELRMFLTFRDSLSSSEQWRQMVQRPAPADTLLSLFRQDNRQQQQQQGDAAGGAGASLSSGLASSSSAADAGKLGGMMWRVKHSLLNVVQPKPRSELPMEELQLRQAKEWLRELQQQLSTSVSVVQNLVDHLNSVAEDFGDLGRSFALMARFEEKSVSRLGRYTPSGSSATQRAADLQLLGYAAVRQHAVDKQFGLRTGASLVFLHDWWVLVPEAVATLEEREDFYDKMQLLRDELQDKQQQAAAAAASSDKRMTALYAAAEALQDKLVAAQEQYEVLKERNQTELVRLSLHRAVDYRVALTRFAQVQLQLAQACSFVWSSAVEQLMQDSA